jgi:hypothetical protein
MSTDGVADGVADVAATADSGNGDEVTVGVATGANEPTAGVVRAPEHAAALTRTRKPLTKRPVDRKSIPSSQPARFGKEFPSTFVFAATGAASWTNSTTMSVASDGSLMTDEN